MDNKYAEKSYPYPPPSPVDTGYDYEPPAYQDPPPSYTPLPMEAPGVPPQLPEYPGPPVMPPQHPVPPPPVMFPAPLQHEVHYSRQYPNTVVVKQPVRLSRPLTEGEAPNEVGCAVFACLCCFCPFGLVAIVKALEARQSWYRGDDANSRAASESARKWIFASVVLGIVLTIGSILLKLLARKMLRDDSYDYRY